MQDVLKIWNEIKDVVSDIDAEAYRHSRGIISSGVPIRHRLRDMRKLAVTLAKATKENEDLIREERKAKRKSREVPQGD